MSTRPEQTIIQSPFFYLIITYHQLVPLRNLPAEFNKHFAIVVWSEATQMPYGVAPWFHVTLRDVSFTT